MAQGQVTKIYELRSIGFDQLHKELGVISTDFIEVKKAKQEAMKTSAEAAKSQKEESQAMKDAKKAYDDAKVSEMQLRTAMKERTNEQKAATLAAKAEADQQKQAASAADIAANSYANLYKSYRELYSLTKNADKNSTITFQGNTYGYDAAISKLKQLSALEQNWRRQFTRDNTLVGEYTSGIVQAFKQVGLDNLIGGQITKTKQRLSELDTEFNKLRTELSEVGVNGAGNFEKIEREMIANRNEAQQLQKQVGVLETEFRGVGNIGNQITESIASGFKNMRGQLAQFVIGYIGFNAVMQGTHEIIHLNEDLSDSLAQLQIYLKGNKQDADDLFDSLKKINTRTSLTSLVDIATLVARKGVAKEEISGITEALDRFFVVAGKDAGPTEETTASIVKLISIFNDDKHITKERVEEITSALFGLQSSGVATSSKMIDVAERIGAVRGITGVSLPSVLGFAAAIEQLGQRSEVAGSAGGQILTKMLANVQKYADAARIPVQKLQQMIKDNPFEAVVSVAEKLKNGGKDFEEIAQDFEEVGLNGVRMKAVFADIATNADFVRKRINDANVAMKDTNSLMQDNSIKQKTFAAVVADTKKEFEVAFTNEKFTSALKNISTGILTIIKIITAIPFAVWVTGLSLVTAAWAAMKGQVIADTIAQLANNEGSLLGFTRMVALRLGILQRTEATAAQTASTVINTEATIAETAATEGATVATTALNTALRVSPLGVILSILGLLIPVVTIFASSMHKTTAEINEQNRALLGNKRFQDEINASIVEQTTKTKNSIDELISIIKTENKNLELRKQAYDNLIKIAPEFTGTVDNEYRALSNLNDVYNKYIENLEKVARAKAIEKVKQKYEDEKAQADVDVFQKKLEADNEAKENEVVKSKHLQESRGGYGSIASGGADDIGAPTSNEKQKAYVTALQKQKEADNNNKDLNAYLQTLSDEDKKEFIKAIGGNDNQGGGSQDLASLQKQLSTINSQIAALDKIKKLSGDQAKQLKDLRKQRTEIKKQIKELGGKTTDSTGDYAGSHLSGEDRDASKEIDAQRDNQLASYELQIANQRKQHDLSLQEEEEYLKHLQQINDDADNKKIAAIQGSNAAEQAARAKLQLGIINRANDTTDKIKSLYKKQYDDQSSLLKKSFEDRKAQIDLGEEQAKNNLGLNNEQYAIAQANADEQRLLATKKYYSDLLALSSQYKDKQADIELERNKAIADAQKKMQDDTLKIAQAKYSDINDASDALDNSTKRLYANQANSILSDASLSDNDKKQKLQKNEDDLTTQLLQIAAAKALAVLNATKDNFNKGTATQADVNAASANYSKAVQDVGINNLNNKDKGKTFTNIGSFNDLITKGGDSVFGFNEDSDKSKAWSQTVQSSFQTAQNAMQNYFDVESINIENSLKLQERQIDAQKRVALGHAQSSAEQETIEREAQEKQLAAQKAAFEENKKMQKAQAAVNLAMQLSNIAVIAFSPNPLNILTLGTWGIVFAAVQTALALTSYAMNISKINAAQFAGGGRAGSTPIVPIGNGKITTGPNIPVQPNGDNIIATVKSGEVVLNKNQQALLGGDETFAAIGVPGFASGGSIKSFDYGGTLGLQYSAPAFYQRNDSEQYEAINKNAENVGKALTAIAAVHDRIDKLEVYQVTSSVTKAQRKEAQQKSIGSL